MSHKIFIYSEPSGMTKKETWFKDGFAKQFSAQITRVKLVTGYYIDAEVSNEDLDTMAGSLFMDPVVERFAIDELPWDDFTFAITTGYKPGVTDNIGHTASIAVKDLGLNIDESSSDFIHSFSVHVLWNSTKKIIEGIAKTLFNPVVEFAFTSNEGVQLPDYNLSKELNQDELVREIPIMQASNDELLEISRVGLLALNLDEMKCIQQHYMNLGREPTDIELETFAQTWSEHCVHKTLKGRFNFEVVDGKTKKKQTIDNLIKSTIFSATQTIKENAGENDICVSVFKDNAGIIKFNDNFNACFKAETHNHPSAKEPYGGAATGIGGVIRDILAAGMGAKPIANTDIFCFAEPNFPAKDVPEGIIPPKKIMEGVVAGVRGYGNPMGIPTVNGSIYFDKRYLGNPLVFCGTIGIIPRFIQGKPSEDKEPRAGDHLVFVGGKTGRDGIHGATFASLEMDKNTTSNPVQIGDPITEQMFMEAMFKARDKQLYDFVQDCGGGGLSSAFGEMAAGLGCVIQLDKVPLKYQGLRPWEIWISESQERQAFAVPPEKIEEFTRIFESEDVGVYNIGYLTDDKRLVLKYNDTVVADINVEFLHEGIPKVTTRATWNVPTKIRKEFSPPDDYFKVLAKILSCWNVCSKEWVIRLYDSEVIDSTVIRPLQGVKNDGPGDAAVLKPDASSYEGLVISNGMNPKYGDIDPYWMAASGIDEAARNAVCSGANPDHMALLDNFCWGNPRDAMQMGRLVLACNACKDISIALGMPFISGKDSLNNEYKTDSGTISIPATLLISAIGKCEDVRKAMTSYFKAAGSSIYILGMSDDELGGSHYLEVIGETNANNIVPRVDPAKFKESYIKLHKAMLNSLVVAAHDCSEGGIAVTLSEMCFSGELGAKIHLSNVPVTETCNRDDLVLFSESNGRIIVEIPNGKESEFEDVMAGAVYAKIGEVTIEQNLEITGMNSNVILNAELLDLKKAWLRPLDFENNLLKEF
ncbi:MAG TPA: phosphoribosylformylglycinamidine synthase subunit PurL [Candidatus Lokiarchaeia archaeon]|nr:phosphoribosylformylglycinamidine synthase subunit PurL [Candidatus Lokiarchaeia archaeon]